MPESLVIPPSALSAEPEPLKPVSKSNRRKIAIGGMVAAVLLLVIAAALFLNKQPANQNTNTQNPASTPVSGAQPVSTPVGATPTPAQVPSQSGQLAYIEYNSTWQYDMRGEIWIYDPATRTRRMVVSEAAATIYSWSPDNRYIAFDQLSKPDDRFRTKLKLVDTQTKMIFDTGYEYVVGAYWTESGLLVVDAARNVDDSHGWSLNFLKVGTFEKTKSYGVSSISPKYNQEFTWAYDLTPPEQSRPYIQDIVHDKRYMFAELGISDQTILAANWVDTDTLMYVTYKGFNLYNVATKKMTMAYARVIPNTAAMSSFQIMNRDTVVYTLVDFSGPNDSRIYKATTYKVNLLSGSETKLTESSAQYDYKTARHTSMDESQSYLSLFTENNIEVLDLQTNAKSDICNSQACDSWSRWSHSLN